MTLMDLMQSGRTQTSFGRNHEKLEFLEYAIASSNFDEHHALVIGAGLSRLPFYNKLKGTPLEDDPDMRKPYSWEVVEVAAILERQRKPYTVTVLDNSPEVREALMWQDSVAVHGYSGKKAATEAYARKFLATLDASDNDDAMMEAINSALHPNNNGENELSFFRKAAIPQRMKERIKAIAGSVVSPEGKLPRTCNIATCMNIMLYVPSGYESVTADAISHAIEDGGLAVTDFKMPKNFRILETFRETRGQDGTGDKTLTSLKESYLYIKGSLS